ncbi:MAG TPA: sulfurtransferase TusA family protein [Acidiferrobacterales bacterium]|jgi:tRNA 2-thiouridine synthesizing protein A
MSSIKADRRIDLSGACCPVPIMETNKTIKTMQAGEVLEVISTDVGSHMDIPAWCRRTGNALLHQEAANGVYRYLIRRKS